MKLDYRKHIFFNVGYYVILAAQGYFKTKVVIF